MRCPPLRWVGWGGVGWGGVGWGGVGWGDRGSAVNVGSRYMIMMTWYTCTYAIHTHTHTHTRIARVLFRTERILSCSKQLTAIDCNCKRSQENNPDPHLPVRPTTSHVIMASGLPAPTPAPPTHLPPSHPHTTNTLPYEQTTPTHTNKP